MKSQIFSAVLALFLAATVAAQDDHAPANNAFDCLIAPSKPGYFENDSLGITLPDKFVFRPGGPGFVDADGALGMKAGWQRKKKGHLQVSGRRIDASAPPARAYIYDYVTGFQPNCPDDLDPESTMNSSILSMHPQVAEFGHGEDDLTLSRSRPHFA